MSLPWRGIVRQSIPYPDPDFAQGILFAPDASHVLSWTEECRLHVHKARHGADGTPESLERALLLSEGDTVYSCAWWPLMSSEDPSSCCFFAASKDHPIHMWDACSGRIAQSYRAYDDADQIVSPVSIGFVSCAGPPRLLSGFNRVRRQPAADPPPHQGARVRPGDPGVRRFASRPACALHQNERVAQVASRPAVRPCRGPVCRAVVHPPAPQRSHFLLWRRPITATVRVC